MARGEYNNDNITDTAVLSALQGAGLRYKDGRRYITSQCPLHEDRNPSVQIFKNDWFVNCLAGCGRFHITKAFPDLRSHDTRRNDNFRRVVQREHKVMETKYKHFDLMKQWQAMPLIPRDHKFKGLPLELLDEMGWRWDKGSYFIPYFNETKTAIPFAQWRHLSGERRFTFLKDAKPRSYGVWNVEPNMALYVVEGSSDGLVLDYCDIPWLAMPSAASGALMRSFAIWAKANNVRIIYGGDNDTAGDKLRQVLEDIMPYRVRQARPPYKDYGEMFEAEGKQSVTDWCNVELDTAPAISSTIRTAMEVFPGSVELKIAS